MPDATSLHHCLKNKQLKLNAFSGKDQQKEYLILCTLRRVVANTCIYLTTHPWSWKSTLAYRKMAYTVPYNLSFARLATGLLVSNA